MARHFYLTGREGLYPHYPKADTVKLILTESIIDAASLLQQQSIKDHYSVLALYGTNGLTDEHLQAILLLHQLKEILFMLDADEAGEAAIQKHSTALKQLLPAITFTKVNLPAGEDVNSVLQSHDDPQVLVDLIEGRQAIDFFSSIESRNNIAEQKRRNACNVCRCCITANG